MSETVATPAQAAPAADNAAATPPAAPSAETTAPLAPAEPNPAVPTFVQSVGQPAQADPNPNAHAPKPELVSGDWRELIPMDLRDHGVWNKVHSVEDALRSFVNAQDLIGKKEIPVGLVKPEAGASQEEVSKYRLELAQMLGVPDSAERYRLPEIAEKVNGADKLMQMAHKSGLGNEQFSSMMEQIAQAEADHSVQVRKTRDDNLKALQAEWGASYEQNLQVADVGLEAVDPDGSVRKILNDTGLNQHPVIIKHYHELGAQFREGTLKTGEPSSKETLLEQITQLKKSDAYWEQGLDSGATRTKVDKLMKQAGLRE